MRTKKKNINVPGGGKGPTPLPEKPKHEFPIVGIGASAGGLEAFQRLITSLPTNTGMAFVLVQHLDPTHESALTQILSKATKMLVSEVKDETRVEPNHVYTIPPNANLALSDGYLRVLPRPEGLHLPIDSFFKTLAQVRGGRAIGVILSGSGSDGALGLQAIKAEEGLTFAQDSKTAKYDQMPLSAVATGCVDFILDPSAIAKELLRISQHPYLKHSRQFQGKREEATEQTTNDFNKILALLRSSQKVDFTHYKHSTLNRRILRRMLLHKIDSLESYVNHLNGTPSELQDLFNDLLINVTCFFRDPKAFQALKNDVFPSILKDRSPDSPIRIWVPGCATGEEVYSIVICLMEELGDMATSTSIHVFATDISAKALKQARTGIYSVDSLKKSVSSERLRRFFIEVEGGYQITKQIRDQCVFAVQNVTADPPFSKMDLISCRNLLIYLEAPLQKTVLSILHYALKDSGFLFLGDSETITDSADLFSIADKKNKIYSKIATAVRPQLSFPTNIALHNNPQIGKVRAPSHRLDICIELQKEMERVILNEQGPCGVITNDHMDIIEFRGDTSPYLVPAPGKPDFHLLKMAREGLGVNLRSLISSVKKDGKAAKKDGLQVRFNGHVLSVCITVNLLKLAGQWEKDYFLILFKEVAPAYPIETKKRRLLRKGKKLSPRGKDAKLAQLEHELDKSEENLRMTQQSLQATIEAQEAANEELQSASEEISSSNEELQSSNEELETSKEELQSTNEELNTVNDELRNRNIEATQLNTDLINLLTSVRLPIVMLACDLRIRRFNPAAENLLKFIPSDIGRPISDLRMNVVIPNLEALILGVIDTGTPNELEVQDQDQHWYSLLIRPYRALDNKIDGAVLIIVDIHALKQTANYTENIVRTVRQPLLILDSSLRVITANQYFYDVFAVSPPQTEKTMLYDLGDGQWNIPDLRKLLEEILPKKTSFDNFEVIHDFPGLGRRVMILNARRILREPGMQQQDMILLAIEDVTDRRALEERLQHAMADLQRSNEELERFAAVASHDLTEPLRTVSNYCQLLSNKYKDKFDEQGREYLDYAVSGAKRMSALIHDLLEYSHIGSQPQPFQEVDWSAVVNQVTTNLGALLKENEVEVTVGPLPNMMGDFNQLVLLIQNLFSNAIKYRKRESPPRIDFSVKKKGNECIFSVRDNGIGIEKEHFSKIFDIFQRLHSQQEYSGTGIGLATCRKIVENHRGKIWVTSDPGKGSTFFFSLPISLCGRP